MELPRTARRRPLRLAAAIAAFLLAGCSTPALVATGAGTAGVTVAQERSVGDAISDNTIAATINKLWLEYDWRIFRDVGTEVTEGRVLLTGKVETPQHELDAVRLTWQAAGVREVIDEIKVTNEGSVVDYARDVWISTQMRTKITFDEKIRAVNYSIVTVDGVIYLMGIAQDQEEVDRVMDYGRDIAYVRSIVSHVLLKSDPRRAGLDQ